MRYWTHWHNVRMDEIRRRSVKGAIRVRSAEGQGVMSSDARLLAAEAAARALCVVAAARTTKGGPEGPPQCRAR